MVRLRGQTVVNLCTGTADRLGTRPWAPETLAIGARVVYYWIPEGLMNSKLAAAVARTLGDAVTTRDWATLLKLHELTKP